MSELYEMKNQHTSKPWVIALVLQFTLLLPAPAAVKDSGSDRANVVIHGTARVDGTEYCNTGRVHDIQPIELPTTFEICTGTRSTAIIRVGNRVIVRIWANTSLKLDTTKDQVTLHRGDIFLQIIKRRENGFEIITQKQRALFQDGSLLVSSNSGISRFCPNKEASGLQVFDSSGKPVTFWSFDVKSKVIEDGKNDTPAGLQYVVAGARIFQSKFVEIASIYYSLRSIENKLSISSKPLPAKRNLIGRDGVPLPVRASGAPPLDILPACFGDPVLRSKDFSNDWSLEETVDFGPYLIDLSRRVRRNWIGPHVEIPLKARVLLTIARDGTLVRCDFISNSFNEAFDNAAMSAVRTSAPFCKLPILRNTQTIEIELSAKKTY